MAFMPATAMPAILHLAGYACGALLYGMLLAMLLREAGRVDRLARATAVLGLTWNVGELAAYAARAFGAPGGSAWLSALAYTALGLLAAVVIHSVSRVRRDQEWHRALAVVVAVLAYAGASAAGAFHLGAAATDARLPSATGLDVLTASLAALSVPLILVTRRQDQARRTLWMVALAIFAVSALHLSRFHGRDESWAAELVGHHASIPLAFAMLYRDYRFALADLFLKRALTMLALVSIVLAAYAIIARDAGGHGSLAAAFLIAAWVVTALVFPALQRGVHLFVDRVVLARANYSTLLDRIVRALDDAEDAETALARTCDLLGPALTCSSVTCSERQPETPLGPGDVAVATAEPPHYVLHIGTLAGGRRLLSDDQLMLDHVAAVLARHIDAIRLTNERYEQMLREREIRALATEAELKALRSQVNPHFLFNALTTIGYLIQASPSRALDTLMRLTTLLRSVLRSPGEFTSLGRERELIECYLEIERERFGDRLSTVVDIPSRLSNVQIPAMIVQPLVENAVKHGIAPARLGGSVTVTATIGQAETSAPELCVLVRNTGAPLADGPVRDRHGVGLRSVERRLACYYDGAAAFSLRRADDDSTLAEIRLPVDAADRADVAGISGDARA